MYENQNEIEQVKDEIEKLYPITQITNMFPHLTKHVLTNGISEGILQVFWVGNHRHFYLKDIHKFQEHLGQKRNVKPKSNWRNNE